MTESNNSLTAEQQRNIAVEALKSLVENLDEGDFISTTRIDKAKAALKACGVV